MTEDWDDFNQPLEGPEKTEVKAKVVRAWARERELPVGRRGHLSVELTDKFNRAHRKQQYINRNPSVNR